MSQIKTYKFLNFFFIFPALLDISCLNKPYQSFLLYLGFFLTHLNISWVYGYKEILPSNNLPLHFVIATTSEILLAQADHFIDLLKWINQTAETDVYGRKQRKTYLILYTQKNLAFSSLFILYLFFLGGGVIIHEIITVSLLCVSICSSVYHRFILGNYLKNRLFFLPRQS